VEEPQPWVEDEAGFLPGLDDGRNTRRRGRGPGDASSRKRRKRGRRAVLAAGMVILLVVVAVLGVTYSYWRKYYSPPDFPGPGTGSVVAQIKSGDTATVVGQRLASLGVVDSARAFSIADSDDGRHPGGLPAVADHRQARQGDREPQGLPAGRGGDGRAGAPFIRQGQR
jgi:hypothetical protein